MYLLKGNMSDSNLLEVLEIYDLDVIKKDEISKGVSIEVDNFLINENGSKIHYINIVTKEQFLVDRDLKKSESLEEKIARLEHQLQVDKLITFEVLATIYGELLALKGE